MVDGSLDSTIFELKACLLDRIGTDDEVNAEQPEIRVDKDGYYYYYWFANTESAKKNDFMKDYKLVAKLERHYGKVIIKMICSQCGKNESMEDSDICIECYEEKVWQRRQENYI